MNASYITIRDAKDCKCSYLTHFNHKANACIVNIVNEIINDSDEFFYKSDIIRRSLKILRYTTNNHNRTLRYINNAIYDIELTGLIKKIRYERTNKNHYYQRRLNYIDQTWKNLAELIINNDIDRLYELINIGISKSLLNQALALIFVHFGGGVSSRILIIKMLLEEGVELNDQDFWGQTVLIKASKLGTVEIVKLLIDYGADKTIHDKQSSKAIDYAIKANNEELIKLLS